MDILISGASIAGPALAHRLARHGHRPTVVERAAQPRQGGYPIDVRGPAIGVLDRMGILDAVRQDAVHIEELRFVDGAGKVRGRLRTSTVRRIMSGDELEIARGDLVQHLYKASVNAGAEYLLGDGLAGLRQDEGGVTATFAGGAERRFDLVIGADGLHSTTRRLAFPAASVRLSHLGFCVALADVPAIPGPGNLGVFHNRPGTLAGTYTYKDRCNGVFIFRSSAAPREVGAQRALLEQVYAGQAWRVPELLASVPAAPDFYFDTVSQVRIPAWSNGRVALVGDAAHCPALLSGQGTTLARVGAEILADELATSDFREAFKRYEEAHRPYAQRMQNLATSGSRLLVPATRAGIVLRDAATRLSGVAALVAPLFRGISNRSGG